MIDVNMLPRELTGYVGHVCGLWFGSYFIDFEPVFVHSTAGIIGELYEYLVDTVQDNSMNGGLDYEDAEEYAKLAATVPWSMEEIDRVAEQSFRYVSDRTLQVAYALCVLTFDAMFPQKIEVVKPDVRETLLSVAFRWSAVIVSLIPRSLLRISSSSRLRRIRRFGVCRSVRDRVHGRGFRLGRAWNRRP